ncbi:MAG TPA: cytochrome B [Saprospiraceae bacterium]|nr:cytochrome B [Saprospiraceae bacterium]HRW75252.1 cytochrome B [Saprospiraceae bacterium]
MYDFLVHFHSGWRWVFLVLLVLALLNNLVKWRQNATQTAADQKWNLYAMSAAHLQLIVGFILYFISPKVQFGSESMSDPVLRFFLVEHLITMLVAVALITVGYSRGKRGENETARFRLAFWFYLGGLIFVLAGIPWPWKEALGAGWF